MDQFLGALNAARLCCETKWGTDGGVWDKAQLVASDTHLAEYQSEGLWWWLVDKSVEVAFPQIPVIFERALNTEHHIGVGETFDQMFVQVRSKAMINTAEMALEIMRRLPQKMIGSTQKSSSRAPISPVLWVKPRP